MSFCFPRKLSVSDSYTRSIESFSDNPTSESSLFSCCSKKSKEVNNDTNSRVICSPSIKSEVLNYICYALIVATIVCVVTTLTVMSTQPHFHFKSLIQHMTNPITIMLMTTSVLMLSLMAVSTAIGIRKLINHNSSTQDNDMTHEFLTRQPSLHIDDNNAPTLTDIDLSSVALKTGTPDAEHKISATGNSLPKQYIFDVVSSMLVDDPQVTQLIIYESLTKLNINTHVAKEIVNIYLLQFKSVVMNYRGKEITNNVVQKCIDNICGEINTVLSNKAVCSIEEEMRILEVLDHNKIFANLIELLIGFNELLNSGEIQ